MSSFSPFSSIFNKTQTEYIRRIGLAVDYIKNHLDESIRLEDVAEASFFSPYHFHRLFHGITGETVNDYIMRKRMECAARRLVYKRHFSVTDVASMGGFSSSANFSKAFKLYFGITPSDTRNPLYNKQSKIGKLQSKYGKAFSPQELYPQFVTNNHIFDPDKLKELMMNVKVKQLPHQKVAYLSSEEGYQLASVYEAWERILDWAKTQGVEAGIEKRFAFCHDNPAITPKASAVMMPPWWFLKVYA